MDKRAYTMTLDDVPKEHRAVITEELKRRGLPTSDKSIISTYVRGQEKKAQKGK